MRRLIVISCEYLPVALQVRAGSMRRDASHAATLSRVAVDLLESVVACVRLGNIVALDSPVGQSATIYQSIGIHVIGVGACPTARVCGRYWVQDVSSFSSIEKISPALSSRLRTM